MNKDHDNYPTINAIKFKYI